MHYYTDVLKKYVVFAGRAGRAEYWYFVLINFIIFLILGMIDTAIFGQPEPGEPAGSLLTGIYSLAVFLPSLAVSVRRLHDTNRSGLWLLLSFIPIIGFIVLLVFMIQGSTPGANRFGPNPNDEEGAQPRMPMPGQGGGEPMA